MFILGIYSRKKIIIREECARAHRRSWPIVSGSFFSSSCSWGYKLTGRVPGPDIVHENGAEMLQLLTFLLEKLSLLSKFKLFESGWPDSDQDKERRAHRGPPQLRRGDLLEVPRTIFTHYGIYLGEHKVAHLIPDILPVLTNDQRLISTVISNKRLILGCIYRCATVRVDTLEDFAYGSKIRVNSMDKIMKSKVFSNEDVANRAEQLIGGIPYSLLWNNCEHFVTYCRYGTAASRQTEKVGPFRRFCEWGWRLRKVGGGLLSLIE